MGARPQTLWRAHSDAVNGAWLAERLARTPVGRLLKTDLFDEVVGSGLYPLLAERAHSVVGIDISPSTTSAAHACYAGLRVVAADVRSLPFASGAFDVVVSSSTLDHFASVADITTALRELHRVLRPSGQLLLTLDNLANPVVALRNALPFRVLHAVGLVPYAIGAACGPRRLQRAASQAGFEVQEVGAILHCPRVLAVAACALLEHAASASARRALLRSLARFERLAEARTRFLTGYFTAIVARRT